ncbi:MAG: methenyltetrahydromethanopterin cyclohydrolase [Ardenticatenaceae bacterium]|nr:methenyltetrahydromethanopterin cyclohydrolase [Ardenticatenaceae bacterium]
MNDLNERAYRLAQDLIAAADQYGVAAHTLDNGAVVVDCGIDVPGGLEAGRRFAAITLGGAAEVRLTQAAIGDLWLPAVEVTSDDPVRACLGAQYAGWSISGPEKYFAMGSGPARALAQAEPLFEELGYAEHSDVAVLALEGAALPPVEVAARIAERCGVSPEHLVILIAPTASLVGTVQIAARSAETGLHKLHELEFPLDAVVSALGVAPISPVAKNDLRGIGRTNDAILYGARAYYAVRSADAAVEAVIERLPATASRDYGRPFYDLFKSYNFDFYQVDPHLFSPGQVVINNLATGRTWQAGRLNPELLSKSFFEG